jgi:AcrR family transcriptional regulator
MNKIDKRALKEANIINVAEKVFANRGYENTKMEDIAAELGISKGTIYFYFNSKENLYMAITFRAYQKLVDLYNSVILESKGQNGLETVMKIMGSFMDFSETNYIYSEAMLNYFSFVRQTGHGKELDKLTEGMKDSVYYKKVQEIQRIPIDLTVKEIKRGITDGSIRPREKPQVIYLNAWALVIGFMKLNDTAVTNKQTIMKINVNDWKEYILQDARNMIKS